MKFSEVTNAVRAYFNRNWTMEDLMNDGEIPEPAYIRLMMVYLTLFYAMASFTFGSLLHLILEAGGTFTVLSSVASLLCLYFTSPLRVRTRVSLLMYAACNLGASFSLYTKYLFKIDQILIFDILDDSTRVIALVWLASLLTRERRELYAGCLSLSCALIFYSVVVNSLGMPDSPTASWMAKFYSVQAMFIGYLVIYSQEILYDAQFGEINSLDRALTVFFHLPAIVVHAARLFLGAEIEQHRQY